MEVLAGQTLSAGPAVALSPTPSPLPAIAVAAAPVVPVDAPKTLAEVLRRASEAAAPRRIVRVASDGGEVVLSYAGLLARAEGILGGLRFRGTRPGDAVVLHLEAAEELLPAFWACVLGGFTAVPVGVPGPGDGAGPAQRLRDVWTTLDGPLVIAGTGPAGAVEAALGAGARVAPLAELAAHAPEPAWHPSPPEAVAALLLSSGTTGRPRLVQRTHHNLLCVCQRNPGLAGSAEIIFLNWLPLDHNAGLTSSMATVAAGADQVQLGTRDVLEAPERWLEGLHRYRVTHTGGTNYSLGLINAHLAAGGGRAGWDFSRVQSFVVSAEPVAARTLRAFVEHLAPYGLRPEVLRPSYGMTEAGGITRLTALRLDEGGGDAFVEAGTPFPGMSLRVVDAEGRVVEEGREGRIQVRGDTVTPGYARDPVHTRESFTEDGWFDTGDAGFLRAGSLTITGREKDVLIVNGLNLASQEVEAAIEEVEGVERGCTAVCAVRGPARDTDAAAVFLHTSLAGAEERDALRREVRRVVAARFGATVAHLLLVDPDDIPRTLLGKVQRPALRLRLEAGGFAARVAEDADAGGGAGHVAPRTEVERALCAAWAEVLGVARVGVHDDFLGLGGHSLLAARVVSRVRGALGVELPLRVLFEARTVAALAERVEALRIADGPAVPPVLPVGRADPPPASFAQERLWFLDRLQPGTPLFNLPVALRIEGALDRAALERALGEIVRRHEALRTTFAEVRGAPVQVIAPAAQGFTLPVEALSGLGAEAREAEVRRRAAEDAARPFDLSAGPLFRAALLRLGAREYVLLLCMHHVVGDGWSLRVLFGELAALYEAYRDGRESPLPALPVQYADHAVWQRGQLRGETLDRQLSWWRERLSGAPELLELPTDHPRPAVQRHRGAREPIRIGAALRERLEALGRSEGATLFMVVLGAFQALLARHAGSDDVVVGSTVAGRTRGETEGLIGLFMNVLVLRTDLSGAPSFREVLRRVREVALAASEHQDVPFERLVRELRPERSLDHSPLVQVLFELQNDGGPGAALSGLGVRRVEAEADTAKFDLSVTLGTDAGGLAGGLTYDTDLFDRGTARRLGEQLERVLEQVAGDPDRRLSRLELIAPAERRRVLEDWNRTETAYPADRCIHQLFEAQAERTPDAVAVVCAGASLTYRELDERANRLARHLAGTGVAPEVRVGVCLERSPELVVSILGVMKAGGAWVPVDPAHPAERIGYVLEDAAVAVVLTQERLREALPARRGVRVVAVDGAWGEIAAGSAEPLESGVGPENLAYVIYTSGSTGRPKGVAMHHRGVCNYLHWGVRAYGAEAGSGAPVFSSMAVDLTLTNLLPLFAGRPVHLLPEENAVEALADALRGRPEFGLVKITPVHLSLLTPLLTPEEARTAARTLVIGADFLSAETTLFWQDHAPGVRLMNEYGPTETVVGCSAYVLPPGKHRAGPVPVGHPIQNLRFYVLDAHLEPVPVGLPGELCIGGAGVARGYLGRPALTAEKFLPDPFAEAGARMYRTGDRARWRADGNLLILGRTDAQVKIRGYRVEPGEIEAVLRRHEAVSGCLVVVREDAPGDRRLVAYVVADGAGPAALREHLRRRVPDSMVPSAFVMLASLPRTATGKVDPKTLPAPEYAADEARYRAPATPAEALLAEIWADVLRLDRVGTGDNFFELGGDSILSIQVVSRARRAGLELTPRQLFEHQTIAELAAAAGGAWPVERRAEPGRVAGPVPLTPIQAWLLAQDHARPAHYNQSMLLAVDPAVPDAALEAALAAVVEHHDALRLRVRRTDAGWEQWHADEAGITLERADLSPLDPDGQDRALEAAGERVQASLDLEHGPLGRAVLFARGGRGRVLLLVLHHWAVDGVSWRILREDLERACGQIEAGQPLDLGAKGTPFQQWAEALRAYAGSEAARAEAGYWLAQGPDGVPPLPVDGTGERTVAGRRTVEVGLDEAETRALLQEVPAAYRTQVNDVLLCALAEAVGGWTGSARVRLALEGHGREEEVGGGVDLTRTVGWFTSVYPVVLETAGAAGPGERLKRVKEQLRAIPGRGIGHGALRWLAEDADLRARLAAQAEPEIVFNYLGQFDQGLSLARRFRFGGGRRGSEVAAENHRPYLLAVDGSVHDGSLRLRWTYGEGTHRRETVERLADAFLRALRGVIAHCRQPGAGGCTPSDFPLAGLGQAELDALLAGRSGVEDLYPLAPLQEGMLFHALSGAGPQAYQVQVARRLEGRLDAGLFRRAWAEVVARHPALRTSFAWRGVPTPLQRVEAAVRLPWRVERWTGLAEAEQEARLERYLAEDRARGFALDEAPLMRLALFQVAGDAHWLVWSHHHLLTDGWSNARIWGEVLRLYRAWSTGAAAELARPRPYRDYVGWLRRQDAEAAERYWTRVLAGFASPTPLPADRAAEPGAEPRQTQESLDLAPATARAVEEAARRAQVTLNTLLQGMWGLLLARSAGEEEAVFGATVSGRPDGLPGVEEMIGLFINTLPVRVRVRGAARLDAWLGELQRAQAEAREYGYAPLARVQGWSGMPPGTPLFESHFIFENHPVEEAEGPGGPLRTTRGRMAEWGSYPLSLMAVPGEGLRLRLNYDANRFDAPTAGRMLERLRRLLEQAAEGVDRPLSALTLLSAAERRQLLEAWSGGGGAYSPRPVHHLVAEQAARTPDAHALSCGGRTLTCRALDAASNRLAHHLAARGAGPESVVAVVAGRAPATVVSILAVLKAGAAYLPLDPEYPEDRLRHMLADAGARLLVSDGAPPAALRGEGLPPVVDLRADAEAIAGHPDRAPEVAVDPDNLAYVIYTSGSTGTPKGVAVPHRGIANMAVWKRSRVGQGAGDRVLQFASFSFDAAAEELFTSLLTGSTLVMAEREALLPPEPLADTLRRERVTVAVLPPAALAVLDPAGLPDLRAVVSAGDALSPAVAARWAGAVELHNGYGPTEVTVGAASARMVPGARPSLGRPLENVRAYLLDGAGGPVPAGVPGEVYLGGVGVARGYVGRPALTAERFVPDPFAPRPGTRMYRTGDRMRWSADGALEFVSRLDGQVKIRGFRIETGEVESALAAHPGVREARVVVREDEPGEKRLVAYVVGEAGAAALREHLRGSLPEHMVPAAFVALAALPLTPNGKLDVRALPAPEPAPAEEARHAAPRTPVEAGVAEIWAEVLRLERVGVHDDFFEAGGHSLLAARVVSRIREAFRAEVPLRALFEGPTPAKLAARVEALRRAGAPVPPPVAPAARTGALPLSFAQERLWFLDRLQPGSAAYNIAAALRLGGALDVPALERALGEIVRRHEALRTTFRERDGGPVQVVAPFGGLALPVEDLSALEEAEREGEARRRVAREAARPFDLAAGPLFRPGLLRLGREEHVLLLSMHHAVSDGWSMGVLFRELSALYAAFRDGGDAPLPALPVQYADYAVWQREQLRGEAPERQLAYWRERLAGAPALLELPTDHPRPPVQSLRGAYEDVAFSAAALEGLRALARAEGVTLYMLLLAAFQVLLAKYAGSTDVVVGSAAAGRGRAEVEGLIGFFANTLVLRTDLSGDPEFREVLRRVRETALGAWEHQDVPFERLVAELRPERSLGHSPFFQATFALDDSGRAPAGLPGLRSEPVKTEIHTTKHDLTLELAAGADGVRGSILYAPELFERATIRRMRGHLARLLEQVTDAPGRRLSELELMTAEERRTVVEEWGGRDGGYRAPPVHRLFAAQAARTPDAPALSFAGRTLAYRELDARANRLARHLAARGAGPESVVAVVAERAPGTVVAILAVLKAGAAYLPLDPEYPEDRLRYMLADSGARLLVSDGALPAALRGGGLPPVVDLRADAEAIAAEPDRAPEAAAEPGSLAYVIYTSGSTGRPKGVAVAHHGIGNEAWWSRSRCGLRAGDRVLQFAPFSFDAAVHELFSTFLAGATLVLAGRDALVPGDALRETVRREGVTFTVFPPSVLAVMDPGGLPSLRVVLSAGEALSREVAEPWARAVELHNAYGPTEATVAASAARVAPGEGRPTIGRPLENARACVLDGAGRPVPAGVPGELYLGGAGVARGYLGRPALTAERFVPDPFGGAGARLYRTGDRVRWRADGELEYLGRLDAQVKVRGFRVEPGEIEAVLRRHPAVDDCAVVVREDAPGDRRLVAYVAGAAGADEVRAHLRRHLPAHMVPGPVVRVAALPLTPSGKVDRRALPPPAGVEPGSRRRAAETELEARVAAVWAEVLGVDAVGVEDNFFDLGGHSLLLVRLQARLAAAGVGEVRVVELFQYPTVRALAGWLAAGDGVGAAAVDEAGARGGTRQAALDRRLEARRRRGA